MLGVGFEELLTFERVDATTRIESRWLPQTDKAHRSKMRILGNDPLLLKPFHHHERLRVAQVAAESPMVGDVDAPSAFKNSVGGVENNDPMVLQPSCQQMPR